MSRADLMPLPDIDYGSIDTFSFPALFNRLSNYSNPEKFARWGSLKSSDSGKIPLHGFVDDWRIEAIWRDDYKQVDKIYHQAIVVAPDYTVEKDYPLPLAFWQVWRSRVVARYWQDCGIFVIPALQWSRPDINHYLFQGLADCEIVAVRSPTRGFVKEWEQRALQFLEQNSPKLVLHFGTKAGFDVWENAVNLNLR